MMKKNGFTLIELILYIALIAIFISGAIQFAWNLIYGQVKSETQQYVTQSSRFAMDRILTEIRQANGINSVSAQSLSLSSADTNKDPVIISVNSGQIMLSAGSTGTCSSASPCALTPSDMQVSQLQFTDLSSGASQHIQVSFTVETTADRVERQAQTTFTSSAEVRTP